MKGSAEQSKGELMGGKKSCQRASVLSSDHRRHDGSCLGFNKTQGSLVSGALGLPYRTWLTDLIVF